MILRIKEWMIDYQFLRSSINFLTIESADSFHWFAQKLNLEFTNNGDGFSLLGDDYSEMQLQKHSDAIFSPIELTLNTSNLKKKLYRDLADDLKLMGITEKLH